MHTRVPKAPPAFKTASSSRQLNSSTRSLRKLQYLAFPCISRKRPNSVSANSPMTYAALPATLLSDVISDYMGWSQGRACTDLRFGVLSSARSVPSTSWQLRYDSKCRTHSSLRPLTNLSTRAAIVLSVLSPHPRDKIARQSSSCIPFHLLPIVTD